MNRPSPEKIKKRRRPIFKWLTGARLVTVAPEYRESMLGLLILRKLIYSSMTLHSDGSLTFTVPLYEYKSFRTACDGAKIAYSAERSGGVPGFLMRYRLRAGITAGLLMMFAVIKLSTYFVSDVRITGNSGLTQAYVEEVLAAEGFSVGTYLPDVDFDLLCNDVLLHSRGLAWISVNMRGTVANVEVREILNEHKRVTEKKPANIVASADGQITEVCVYSGREVVAINDVVRKGELLISGLIDGGLSGVRFVTADGLVNAVTTRKLVIYVPFSEQTKQNTGKVTESVSLSLFGMKLTVVPRGGISGLFTGFTADDALCDVEVTKKKLTLFDSIAVPATIETTAYSEYELVDATLPLSEAVAKAMAQLRAQIEQIAAKADILERTDTLESDADGVTVTCELYCLENIAESVEFEVIK